MPDFTLDKDPFIPTGEPATPEDVAAMIADPESPITEDVIPLLAVEQRPTEEQIEAAYTAQEELPG